MSAVRFTLEQERIFWRGIAKNMSHDLGTPLSSVMGWLELLPTMKDSSTAVTEIENSTDRINLISQRLDKLGSQIRAEPVAIYDVVEDAISYLRKRMSGINDLKFENYIVQDILVSGDRILLTWAFEHLLRNGIDAIAGMPGLVSIDSTIDGQTIKLTVQDDGPGIPEEIASEVIVPGFTTKPGGRGIGLSLVSYVVEELHSGSLEISSDDTNGGVTVTVGLPSYQSK